MIFCFLLQVLREAKATLLDTGNTGRGRTSSASQEEQISFVHFFDKEQGTGSWEALELLSSQCAQRLQSQETTAVLHPSNREIFEQLDRLCRVVEYDDSPREQDITELILREYTRLSLGLPKPHALLHVFRTAEDFFKENARVPDTDVELWRRNVHRNGGSFGGLID